MFEVEHSSNVNLSFESGDESPVYFWILHGKIENSEGLFHRCSNFPFEGFYGGRISRKNKERDGWAFGESGERRPPEPSDSQRGGPSRLGLVCQR